LLVATLPANGGDWSGNWLGVPMFFGGLDANENLSILTHSGFEVLVAEEFDLEEPEGIVRFQWVLASASPS
jgi:hypothetical protein